jgi:N-formylglutamate amidohydrolase
MAQEPFSKRRLTERGITLELHSHRQFLLRLLFLILFLSSESSVFAQVNADTGRLMTVRAGSLPIILTAPHGGRQPIANALPRRGIGVSQFTTGRDNNTDELAELIAEKLRQMTGAAPFLIVARFERKYVDANRPAERAYESEQAKGYYEAYHRALADACRRVRENWGRGLLLDIHGQGSDKETIFRGTGNGKSIAALIKNFGREAVSGEKSIFKYLEDRNYKVAPETRGAGIEQRYTGGYTTRTYGSDRGTAIDAIQLEFGSVFRARANLERTAADLAEAIATFAEAYLPRTRISATEQLIWQSASGLTTAPAPPDP